MLDQPERHDFAGAYRIHQEHFAGRQLHAGIDRIAETLDVFHANADGKLLLSILALNATNTFGGFDTRVDDAVKLRAQLPGGVKLGFSHAFASAGRVGRSQGCFAVADDDIGAVRSRLGDGRLLFAAK